MTSAGAITHAPGVEILALRTPTLPPATHTNTVFVGREQVWVVDPATPFEGERERLLQHVERVLPATGRRPRGIFLTHHHVDHVSGAVWLRERTGLPIHAHATTARLAGRGLTVDVTLGEGDTLQGSERSDDRWRVLHTPGHASDHLVLWQERSSSCRPTAIWRHMSLSCVAWPPSNPRSSCPPTAP